MIAGVDLGMSDSKICGGVRSKLCKRHWRIIQTAFNWFGALLLLPAVMPLVAVIAILIKLDSSGPIFFSHMRVGQNGQSFRVWKLRTMHVDAQARLKALLESNPEVAKEWMRYRKLKHDPRITRVGYWLRKMSLDELPQIFNVLTGTMHLVGPRPVTEEEIERYYGHSARYYFLSKPGITGLWQVNGRNDLPYSRRVALDRMYVQRWSFCLDLKILFKTLFVVFKLDQAH